MREYEQNSWLLVGVAGCLMCMRYILPQKCFFQNYEQMRQWCLSNYFVWPNVNLCDPINHCFDNVHVCRCSQCPMKVWWLVPLIAPMIGGAIAAPVYWLFIEANHPDHPERRDGDDVSVQGKRTITPNNLDYQT